MSKRSSSSRAAQNNRSNQLNPNNSAYHSSRQGSGDKGSGNQPGPAPAENNNKR